MLSKIYTIAAVLFIATVSTKAQNTWVQKTNAGTFGLSARQYAAGFSIGNKIYMGTGNDGSNKNDFWEYDPSNDTWTQKAVFTGAARMGAVGFAIGTKGYIGTGMDNSQAYNDLYEYDPSGNSWTAKTNLPSNARRWAVGFSVGNKGYIGTGTDFPGTSFFNDYWEFTPTTNSWTQKTNVPSSIRREAIGFSIGNKGYIGTGFESGGTFCNDFWEWNQISDSWVQKTNFPGGLRAGAVGFSIGTKGYIGTGYLNSTLYQDFYEYDQATGNWALRANFSGTTRNNAFGVSCGQKGYIGFGQDGSVKNDFWEYTTLPVASITSQTNASCIGGNNGSATVAATGGVPPYTYSWSPGGGTGTTAVNLSAGIYTVTVTDANLATGTATVNISQPSTQNTWTQKANLTLNGVGFSIGNKGYTGLNASSNYFWEFDPVTNVWTQKTSFPGVNRDSPVGFSIGTKGYIGLGFNGSFLNDFWEYDPALNSWIAKTNFIGTARYRATAFSIGSIGYVGTGDIGGSSFLNDFYSFDPALNQWLPIAPLAGAGRVFAVSFSIGNKGYVGTGSNVNGSAPVNDFWEYNPSTDSWLQKANFAGPIRQGAAGFSIGNRGFIGTGANNLTFYNDFYEYNPITDAWTLKANFPGTQRVYSVGFAIGNKGYMGGGYDGGTTVDFYEYTSSFEAGISTHTNPTCLGGNDGSATANAFGGTPPYTYSWNSIPVQNSATAINLSAGNYIVTVTDACGQTATNTVTISPPPAVNTWTQKANVGGNGRYGGVSFSIGNKGYVGTGIITGVTNTDEFWEYDQATNTWTQKANFAGGPRHYAAGFSIGTKGYLGTGETNSGNPSSDFYQYDPANNTWSPMASFLGGIRAGAIGLSIGNYGYLGLGGSPGLQQDFWQYNPSNNQWVQKANFGGGFRSAASAFSIGNFGYVGTGVDAASNYQKDLWQYDPANDIWLQKADVGTITRAAAIGFSIGNKGFIGTGTQNGGSSCFTDFYEYNPFTDQWIQRSNYLGIPVAWAAGFAIGNKGYIGSGLSNLSIYNSTFYEYKPIFTADISSSKNVTCTGGSDGTATVIASAGNPPYTYSWSSSPVQNSATAVNLSAGNYTVTITDACGQTASATVAISQSTPDSWTQKANVGTANRYGASGFSIGSKGYIGTGLNPGYSNDFWEWDQATNVWTQKANFGGTARYGAVGFAIGNKGYIGTGEDVSSTNRNDFWEYDPSLNTWLQKAPMTAGGVRYEAVGFSVGNKGYVGTGRNGGTFLADFWEFDPQANTWISRTAFPGGQRSRSVGISIGSKGYIGTGYNGSLNVNDFWEFDPALNSWNPKQNFQGNLRNGAVGFSIGQRGYIGTGDFGGTTQNDLWEYNQNTDAWSQKAFFTGSPRYNAVAFSIGNRGYIGTGANYGPVYNDFYEYYPSTITPVAAFTASSSGQTFTFSNTSVDANTYSWDFGDGTSSTAANPVHTYAYGGVYTVCLTASSYCNTSVICHQYTVSCAPPTASFTSGASANTVNFNNTSVNASSFLWNFGDGNNSVQQNPSHVYFNAGTYTVSLTATNGCSNSTFTTTVTAGCSNPSANFSVVINGLNATFTNNSTNNYNNSWTFNDPASGVNNTSLQANPTHVFSGTGTYNVNLTVTNGCGTSNITIPVNVSCSPPDANFTPTQTGMSILFDGLTSVGASSYHWDFGDGNTSNNPISATHTYSTATSFTVTLTVTNSCGSDSTTAVVNPCAPPSASTFTLSANATVVNYDYTGLATNYTWYFNDGSIAFNNHATHTYATSGTKTVCLKAGNSCGSDSSCQNIFLFCSSGLAPQICMVTVDSLGNYNEIFWDKTGFATSDTFLVYRDTANGNYGLIGKVPFDSLSMFTDTVRSLYAANGDPVVSSWRYKIATKDSCGNISPLSLYHQTIHFQDLGAGNFQWTEYEIEGQGTPIAGLSFYKVKMDTFASSTPGNWGVIQTLSASSTTYTYPQYLTYQPTADWRVETFWNIQCTPTYRTSDPANSTMATIKKSRSNVNNNRAMTTGISVSEISDILIYPNPAKDEIFIKTEKTNGMTVIELSDITGRIIHRLTDYNQQITINTSSLASGVYLVSVFQHEKRTVKKIVVEK